MSKSYRHSAIRFWTPRQLISILAFSGIAISITGLSNADESTHPKTDYAEVAVAINKTMHAYHYNPAELNSPQYRTTVS